MRSGEIAYCSKTAFFFFFSFINCVSAFDGRTEPNDSASSNVSKLLVILLTTVNVFELFLKVPLRSTQLSLH